MLICEYIVKLDGCICWMNTIQYSPQIDPLCATGVSLGPPKSWTQMVSRSLPNFLRGSLGNRQTNRPRYSVVHNRRHLHNVLKERKSKEKYLYSAICILCISQSAHAWTTQFYLQMHHACLALVSVHQMAPPLTEVKDIQLKLTTHLSTSKRWKAELALLVDLWQTVYPHKWSPISYRSRAWQVKFTGQIPTF